MITRKVTKQIKQVKKMNVIFKEFDLDKVTAQDWCEVHEYRKRYHAENLPDDPYMDNKTFEIMVKTEVLNEETSIEIFTICNEQSKIIGLFFTQLYKKESPSYEGNKNVMMYRLEIAKNYRRKGIGSQAMVKIAQIAELNDKSILITQTSEDDGKLFLQRIGAETGLAMRENRLSMKDVDWEMVKSWVSEAEKFNPETKLLKFNRVPEYLLENYCKTFTFAGNQAPKDNLEIGDQIVYPKLYRKREEDNALAGMVLEIAVTVEPDGTVSGLTELMYDKSNPDVLKQSLTAVLKEQRGRKLGKWLKASLLLHVRNKYPTVEFIITGNAESNGPMLSINERLGFKKHKEMIGSQITLNKLKNFVSTLDNVTINALI